MNPRIIFAIAKKDVIDVLKNKNTLMALLTPLIMAVFFLFLANLFNDNLGLDSAGGQSVIFYDPDKSGLSAAIDEQLEMPLAISEAASAEAARDAVVRKEANFGVVVPAGYADSIEAGQEPRVDVYYDAERSGEETAGLIARAVQGYAMRLAGIVIPTTVQVQAVNEVPAAPASFANFDMRSVYSLFALITAVISCGLYIMPNLLVEEKEKKTLRSLIVSPATFSDIIAAKLLVGLLYTIVVCVIVALINLPPADALLLIALGTLLSAIFFNLIGLLIGSVSDQMTTANAYIGGAFFLAFFPMLLVLMPFADLNEGALGVVLHAIPSFYFGDVFRIATQQSPDLAQLGVSVAVCMAMIVAAAGLSIWTLRRQRV